MSIDLRRHCVTGIVLAVLGLCAACADEAEPATTGSAGAAASGGAGTTSSATGASSSGTSAGGAGGAGGIGGGGVGGSGWQLSYTPLTYPHPLQSAWVSSCENTHAATTHSRTDVQAAVDAADDDDCVTVPQGDGTETWSSPVSWTNKRIQLIGPGEANLTVTCFGTCVDITANTAPGKPFRISGFTFTWSGSQNIISGHGSNITSAIEGFRIDHVTFLNTASNGSHSILLNGGIWWGLVDHITNGDGTKSWISIYAGAYTEDDYNTKNRCAASGNHQCMGYDSWALKSLDYGSDDAIVIEDSTFNFPNSGLPFVNDMEFGARMVYRFNSCTSCVYQSHSARYGNRGGNIQTEIYRNTFAGNGFFRPTGPLRGGAAMFWENTVSGYTNNNWDIDGQREDTPCVYSGAPLGVCNGSSPQDGNIDPNGWPCVDQVGRGAVAGQTTEASEQSWAPMRSWSNGTTSTCSTGGSCNNTTNITLNGACGGTLADYLRPHNSAHANGQWDYMNYGDGVYVVDDVGDLPGSCSPGEWAWVRNAGAWNTLGQDGLGYICQ